MGNFGKPGDAYAVVGCPSNVVPDLVLGSVWNNTKSCILLQFPLFTLHTVQCHCIIYMHVVVWQLKIYFVVLWCFVVSLKVFPSTFYPLNQFPVPTPGRLAVIHFVKTYTTDKKCESMLKWLRMCCWTNMLNEYVLGCKTNLKPQVRRVKKLVSIISVTLTQLQKCMQLQKVSCNLTK
jgi:hypothetical protein